MNPFTALDLLFLRRIGFKLINQELVQTPLTDKIQINDAMSIFREKTLLDSNIEDIAEFNNIWIKLAGGKTPVSYEDLVETLKTPTHRKRSGIHLTPSKLADYSIERTIPYIDSKIGFSSISVCDPSCGSGIFLRSILKRMISRTGSKAKKIIYDKIVNNQIIGFDTDTIALYAADLSLREILIRNAGFSFVEVRKLSFPLFQRDWLNENATNIKFDLIIGNPPWVRIHHQDKDVRKERTSKFSILQGRYDLSLAFVECSIRRLKKNGILSFILSNKILMANYGKKARKWLTGNNTVLEIHNLSDSKIFGASVLPMVLIVEKGVTKERDTFVYTHWKGGKFNDKLDFVKNMSLTNFDYDLLNRELWSFGDYSKTKLLDAIEQACPINLGDYAKSISVGIKTTANDVFANPITNEFLKIHPDFNQYIFPVLRGRNIERWIPKWTGEIEKKDTYILYPHKEVNNKTKVIPWDTLPEGVKKWLKIHERILKDRTYVKEANREWYEIWVPQKPSLFEDLKIIVPDISEHHRFALDEDKYFCLDSAYTIKLNKSASREEYLYTLAWLNSKSIEIYFQNRLRNSLYSKRLRYMKSNLSKIPIIPFSKVDKNIRKEMGQMAEKSMKMARVGKISGDSQVKIDSLVLDLINKISPIRAN